MFKPSTGFLLMVAVILLAKNSDGGTEPQFKLYFDWPKAAEAPAESAAFVHWANPGLVRSAPNFRNKPRPFSASLRLREPRREFGFTSQERYTRIVSRPLPDVLWETSFHPPEPVAKPKLDPCPEYEVSINMSFGSDTADLPLSADSIEMAQPNELAIASRDTTFQPRPLQERERDLVIRTILGEAANQGYMGQLAVAHVILNRVKDPRWSGTASGVVSQPRAFSAWNNDGSGNSVVHVQTTAAIYQEAGQIVDAVFAGQTEDPTGGATHYYSPAGMRHLARQGYQSNLKPRWLRAEQYNRAGPDVIIGDHVFTGRTLPN